MPRLADSILRDSELTWIRQSKLAPRKRRQPKSARICAPGSRNCAPTANCRTSRGAEREKEIGGIVDIYQRKIGNPAVLFDDIPGYPTRPSHPGQHPHLDPPHQHDAGLDPADGTEIELVRYWRNYMKEAQDHPAGHGGDRRAPGERQYRRRHRPVQDPGAALARARRRLLHRHRRHGDHARSGHRLDQLRRLSRAGARQEPRHRDVLQGQARRHDPEKLSRARPAVPGRGGVRHAPGAVHDRGPGNSARQERIRRGRRAAWASRCR